MSDCISRQAVRDKLREILRYYYWADDRELDAIVAAFDALPPVFPEMHWIPVTERLPEGGTWNIFTDGKNISVERYKMDAIDHFFPQGRWFSFDEAIAWMPLPESYTDEEIQKMQDMHQAEIEKAFELGREDAKPKWIPVLERCPDKTGAYLITHYDGDVFPRYYDGEDSSKKFWKSYIKAWMPLPEPYQEEGEKDEQA